MASNIIQDIFSTFTTPIWYLRKRKTIDVGTLRAEDDKTGEYRVRKDIKELLQGSVKEIADAYIIDFEVRQLYGKRYLSGRERTELMKVIHSKGEDALKEWSGYLNTYDKLRKYCNEMVAQYTNYKKDLTELVSYVELWDTYETVAKTLTKALEGADEERTREVLSQGSKLRGVTMRKDGDNIVADINGEGQLYEQIVETKENTEDELRMVRAYEVVLYSFLKLNSLEWLLPFYIENTLSVLYDERLGIEKEIPYEYFRYYYRTLALGEETTEEQERRAVIPDYTETKPTKEQLSEACDRIEDLMELEER